MRLWLRDNRNLSAAAVHTWLERDTTAKALTGMAPEIKISLVFAGREGKSPETEKSYEKKVYSLLYKMINYCTLKFVQEITDKPIFHWDIEINSGIISNTLNRE